MAMLLLQVGEVDEAATGFRQSALGGARPIPDAYGRMNAATVWAIVASGRQHIPPPRSSGDSSTGWVPDRPCGCRASIAGSWTERWRNRAPPSEATSTSGITKWAKTHHGRS